MNLELLVEILCWEGSSRGSSLATGALSIVDDSDLVESVHHHAWFEGDEVALWREDRVCLLGNLTGRTPEKRRATRSSSGQVFSNVASSFPVETEQHELEPEGTGASALDCDDVAGGDEDGGDDTASTWKPFDSKPKCVIQNIHNNCGHPSREADAVTKRNGNVPLLQILMRTGRICITEEAATLERHQMQPSSRSSSSKTRVDPTAQSDDAQSKSETRWSGNARHVGEAQNQKKILGSCQRV